MVFDKDFLQKNGFELKGKTYIKNRVDDLSTKFEDISRQLRISKDIHEYAKQNKLRIFFDFEDFYCIDKYVVATNVSVKEKAVFGKHWDDLEIIKVKYFETFFNVSCQDGVNPVYVRNSNFLKDYKNVIYIDYFKREEEDYQMHWTRTYETRKVEHPLNLEKMSLFYKNKGLENKLICKVKRIIKNIRKENPIRDEYRKRV